MGRSSRLTVLLLSAAIVSTGARAQLYGFPSEVGVVDDGFGTLPPSPPTFAPSSVESPPVPPLPPLPPRPPLCPVVIKVGRGLAHPAHVRVVYGRPACL